MWLPSVYREVGPDYDCFFYNIKKVHTINGGHADSYLCLTHQAVTLQYVLRCVVVIDTPQGMEFDFAVQVISEPIWEIHVCCFKRCSVMWSARGKPVARGGSGGSNEPPPPPPPPPKRVKVRLSGAGRDNIISGAGPGLRSFWGFAPDPNGPGYGPAVGCGRTQPDA